VKEMLFPASSPAQSMGFAQAVPLNFVGSQHHHKQLIISMP